MLFARIAEFTLDENGIPTGQANDLGIHGTNLMLALELSALIAKLKETFVEDIPEEKADEIITTVVLAALNSAEVAEGWIVSQASEKRIKTLSSEIPSKDWILDKLSVLLDSEISTDSKKE